MMQKQYTLAGLAKYLEAPYEGEGDYLIVDLSSLNLAKEHELSFFVNGKSLTKLQNTQAGALILPQAASVHYQGNKILVDDVYLAYAKISHLFSKEPTYSSGIHPSAYVAADANIHPTASIGANAVVGEGCKIGANARIGSGCTLGSDITIGDDTQLYPRVSIYHGVIIGQRVLVHSGAVIGSDGFGFANQSGSWVKIAQIGRVIIGNDVEVGANSTIDRGAIEDTVIADGVKIDNLVQVAHNVIIGENSAIAGCAGIAGSSVIGKNCSIGGGVGLSGHITLGDQVSIAGMSLVSKSLPEKGVYASGPGGCSPVKEWRKQVAYTRQLDKMYKRLQKIQKLLGQSLKSE